ncbi:MAG TPA: LysM peptidoglycan-binding domain-containing protein [Chloroflexi bacterium]|nr:LysM peptidoglycan-binding domain-containing protein [Chloroflexota bacterium]
MAEYAKKERRPRQHGSFLSTAFALALLIGLAAIGLFAAWIVQQAALRPYETRIYPRVHVLELDVGGLTLDEAAARIAAELGDYDAGQLILSDGARLWTTPWRQAGLRLDAHATAQRAFSEGRADQGTQTDLVTLLNLLGIWDTPRKVAPIFVIDPALARSALEDLAPVLSTPPTDATLRLEGNELVAEPGQPGQELDVESTLDNIVTAVSHLGPDNQFALTFRILPPQLTDTRGAQAQAEEMLDRHVTISTHDWLTDETFTWRLDRETIITWLRVEPAEEDGSPKIRVAEEAVQATLEQLSAELGEGRKLNLDRAVQRVLFVFEEGGGTVELPLTHPLRSYVVQSGDDLTIIASRVGVPPGLIAEVNPGVDLNWLQIGQTLIIPSVDAVMPYPPISGKEIVINIAEQRMRVYQDGSLLWDWPVSTGIASSPTYTGQFQVLDKNENAYASQWDLWMPHFIAIYRAGGDTYNGIHGLPTLSSGRRLWEGNLGSPASFGCIILGLEEAESLYHWAEIGVLVKIE